MNRLMKFDQPERNIPETKGKREVTASEVLAVGTDRVWHSVGTKENRGLMEGPAAVGSKPDWEGWLSLPDGTLGV